MKRKDYKLNTWYPLTDDEYWVEKYFKEEFPNCQTLVCDTKHINGVIHCITTFHNTTVGWGTMSKQGTYKFMIVEKPQIGVIE